MNILDLLRGGGVQQAVGQDMARMGAPQQMSGSPGMAALRAAPQVFQRNPAAFSQMVGQGNPDLQARLQALARLQGTPGPMGAGGVPMALQRELASGMGPQLNQLPGQMQEAQMLMQMIQAGVTPEDLMALLGGGGGPPQFNRMMAQPQAAMPAMPTMPQQRPGAPNLRDLQMMRGGGYAGE